METLMVDCVQSSLRIFMHRNAIFLCERLCAEFPSELNLQLLATCYLRNNQAYCAYHILKGKQMAQSRYLFAISCFQMNLLREAEVALCPASEPNTEVPNGAAGHYLLGLIYRYTDRRANAIDHFIQALSIDPLLWVAYEELCILGAAEGANECFSDSFAQRVQMQHASECCSQDSQTGSEDHNVPQSKTVGFEDMSPRQSKLHPSNHREILGHSHGAVVMSSNMSLYNTPSPMLTQLSGAAPPPLCRNPQLNLNAMGGDGSNKSTVNAAIQPSRKKLVDGGKIRKAKRKSVSQVQERLFYDSTLRRSTRLSNEHMSHANSNSSQGGNGANHTSKCFSPVPKINSTTRLGTLRKGQVSISKSLDEGRRADAFDVARADCAATTSSSVSTLADSQCPEQERENLQIDGIMEQGSRITSGTLDLLRLLRILGEGYRLSCLYRCRDALEVYLSLSNQQYNTGWVLSQVGKAHFELVDYFEADRAFSLARRVSPYTLEGMDIYSTVLYHLKEGMKLSYLAQELISTDRLSPQAWCALGNCYSLRKDHETAVKIFQRAVHVDSRFTYAHTLCGHEYVSLEDFENGVKCFQSALQVDERHYNSWYGLGVIYLRQEKYEFAEHHFRRGFLINSRSSVIMCYLGMALHALKRDEEALCMMEKAIIADKKNPLPPYEKANILLSLERYDEALKELEQLKESVPRESSVYALMGKIYQRNNMRDKAMFYFGLALDLKPPASDVAAIKSAVEKLFLPDELEDDAL